MAKTPAAKAIDIKSVQRTRKTICIHWAQGDGTFDLDERDNPLPSFPKAFDALTPLVATILHLPAAWAAENLRVIGLIMGEQGGAQTVSLVCRKSLSDASKEFPFKTPPRLLSHPTEPGSYTPPLTEADAGLVDEAVEQAKLYVRGDRAQGQIAFEDDKGADDGSGDVEPKGDATAPLPFAPEKAEEPKPAKQKRGSKRSGRAAAR
jgi:hypothetical protein